MRLIEGTGVKYFGKITFFIDTGIRIKIKFVGHILLDRVRHDLLKRILLSASYQHTVTPLYYAPLSLPPLICTKLEQVRKVKPLG